MVLTNIIVCAWKRDCAIALKLIKATNSNCRFHTNFAVLKIKDCGTLSKHYLHENKILHHFNNRFSIIFYVT